jgi:hypothetical protein
MYRAPRWPFFGESSTTGHGPGTKFIQAAGAVRKDCDAQYRRTAVREND